MRERKIIHTKEFMRQLLAGETWDSWAVSEAQIVCANTWSVDGRVNRAYYAGDDVDAGAVGEYAPWGQIRPVALSLIKGKRTPVSFRFILMPPDDLAGGEAAGVKRVCRIRFAEGHVYAASAVSLDTFTLDKEPERAWDEALSRFLDGAGLEFEEL